MSAPLSRFPLIIQPVQTENGSLVPSTRLGPYEITAQIGVGGMGEVYRATDTNLKRSVAIKVLPESLAADAERLARFQREAEVLAALISLCQITVLQPQRTAVLVQGG